MDRGDLTDEEWDVGCDPGEIGGIGTDRRLATHDRQHHSARPCIGGGRKRGACTQAFGRSRGGFTCKVHARCDNQGRPIGFILTAGEASVYGAVDALMAIPLAKPRALLADKGYDGDTVRENLLMHGIRPIIPPRTNRREPIPCDFRRYRDRNRIERMFGQLKQSRRIATHDDKTALSFAIFLNLAAIRKPLPYFVNAA